MAIPIDSMNHIGRGDQHSFGDFEPGAPCYTLTKQHSHAVAAPIAAYSEVSATLKGGSGERGYPDPSDGNGHSLVGNAMAVRRLTPVESERLQGFPDNYTAIPWRKGTAANCPDGPRYKALGNSMAVPVMRWIGERIQQVEEVLHDTARSKQAA